MSYYRYTRLQQYINGQPTDTYTKGERVDNVDYSTYGTCMGSSANTRWVSIPQTVCYDGDLWSMEKEQISYNEGISWTDTGSTRRASVIEQSSSQCFMSEWRVVPGEYICMMYAKWPKEAEYLSYDGGQTWTATGNIRRGETVIELLSTDCGVIYQWIPTGEYICQGYNKYMKEKQVYSTDNGSTWTDTGNRRPGGLVETDSPYCGYEQYIYQWVDVSGEYVCQGYDKYVKQKEQRSSDMGVSWEDTGNTRAGEYIESKSTDCGYVWLLARKYWTNGGTTDIPGRGRLGENEFGETVSDIVAADILEGTTIIESGALGGNCYAFNTPKYEYIYFYGTNLTEIGSKFYVCSTDTVRKSQLKYMGPVERAVDGKIIIPGNVKTVEYGIASNLQYITEIIFDDGVETIDKLSGGEQYSDSVTTVRLPSTLTSLSRGMFQDLHGLTTVNNFPNATTLPDFLFDDCTSLTSFTIPSTVTSIGEGAFSDSGLTSITVPDSVLSIGRGVFNGCTNLETATLGDGLTSIEAYTFGGCTSLKTLTIGESVTTIDGRWLENLRTSPELPLESIIFRSSTPPSWHDVSSAGAWSKAPNARIYVPCEYVQTYRQAWSGIAMRIEGYNCNQSTDYLTLQALEAGTMKLVDSGMTTKNLRYSKNGGAWTDIAVNENVSVEANDVIRWRGNLQSISNNNSYRNFVITCRFNASGNPLSLVYNNFGNETDISHITGCLKSLFQGTMVVDASGIRLTATTLSQSCYTYMFSGCTYLTSAPALPATTMKFYCYQAMFRSCRALTTAPALPSTIMDRQCYYQMFSGCTSLTTAPVLPATTLATYAYQEMFYGCSSLNYIKAMFTTTPSDTYTKNWVNGVAASGTFVKNSAATWNVVGSTGVPSGWTIETASE